MKVPNSLEIVRILPYGIKLVKGKNGLVRPFLFPGMVIVSEVYAWRILSLADKHTHVKYIGLGDEDTAKETTGFSSKGLIHGLYFGKGLKLPGEERRGKAIFIPSPLQVQIEIGDPICVLDEKKNWKAREFGATGYSGRRMKIITPEEIIDAEFEPEWNSSCPNCGEQAYLGFIKIECSNPNCNNHRR